MCLRVAVSARGLGTALAPCPGPGAWAESPWVLHALGAHIVIVLKYAAPCQTDEVRAPRAMMSPDYRYR